MLTSERSHTAILIELTVPYETNMSESHEFKVAKYEHLRSELHKIGYKTHMFAVEVGARALVGASDYSLLRRIGLQTKYALSSLNS